MRLQEMIEELQRMREQGADPSTPVVVGNRFSHDIGNPIGVARRDGIIVVETDNESDPW